MRTESVMRIIEPLVPTLGVGTRRLRRSVSPRLTQSVMLRTVFFVAALGCLGLGVGCRKAPPPPPLTQVVVAHSAQVPSDPGDPAWQTAPEYVAKLLPQDLVEPRQIENSTAEVRVRAASDGRELAVRLEWADPSQNDLPLSAQFCDGCAIQLPAKIDPTLPAPQMGEPGRAVEIAFWSAAWQAAVDGRGDTIRDVYPNATVDHYPFEAQSLEEGSPSQVEMAARYAPARSLGNTMAGPRATPVQDLIAEGPGTLAPAPSGESKGRGVRTAEGWSVVIVRRLPEGLSPQAGTQVALAVWEGGHAEVGARKMRTGWVPMVLQETP